MKQVFVKDIAFLGAMCAISRGKGETLKLRKFIYSSLLKPAIMYYFEKAYGGRTYYSWFSDSGISL